MREPAGRRRRLLTAPRPGRGRARDRGSSGIELAFVAPAVLVLIFFTIQIALWMYGRNVALQAAREGVSQLRLVQPTDDIGAAKERAEQTAVTFAGSVAKESLGEATAQADYDAAADRATVTIHGTVFSLVPGVSLSVTRSAAGSIETFEPDG